MTDSAEHPVPSRDHGIQPITQLMAERRLKPKDLVASAPEPINHKMVSRAMKGRQLTPSAIRKVTAAFCAATGKSFGPDVLFRYATAKGQIVRGPEAPQ